jgi:hypothetical protein
VSESLHLCWVDGDPDDNTPPHYRPCPPDLCEARDLHNLMVEVVQELKDRLACLEGARDDLDAIQHASIEDGGIWIRAVAQGRQELVEAAISEINKTLVALGSFDLGV